MVVGNFWKLVIKFGLASSSMSFLISLVMLVCRGSDPNWKMVFEKEVILFASLVSKVMMTKEVVRMERIIEGHKASKICTGDTAASDRFSKV